MKTNKQSKILFIILTLIFLALSFRDHWIVDPWWNKQLIRPQPYIELWNECKSAWYRYNHPIKSAKIRMIDKDGEIVIEGIE